ncbi:MAG: methylenetetrahydrofolate--tRNA-(uracil(54)-C(5))-methyltransferase (FADH(2)-oxidizing) TrmFO [Terracidiphilus sp.]|nr:methylenetetrahydrofolate--tRNA-(uracil(54)-C(5))-methyltransferase (FADH(2)-oxidizing) TrmFO [Terracidiphilus sp.]MDR3797110.1 methylenetetrahydrofolate--tRNA-(uracil(54)-C(5))-methyltransferase (FADH(2)-oxidizing) TrmFO [Terracidiphilus sp.]
MRIRVIGGGLAGPEAALTAARLGCEVDLYEMRAVVDGKPRLTPAHQTTDFGELVCSNSLKSESEWTAPWLLKQEMRRGGSALLRIADACAVPAGHALAVDRVEFSRRISEAIEAEPRIRVIREEVTSLEDDPYIAAGGVDAASTAGLETGGTSRAELQTGSKCTIVATGPLTSDALGKEIERLTGAGHLAFYDSISPIVDAESIDMSRVYFAARWDKGTADYINCPMDRAEYDCFYDALLAAEAAESKEWERLEYFEGCLPIEVLATRGRDTLRFGPMKPVGLRDPRTGKNPWAVVQLRKENLRADSYNLVGFQNHLKFGEQARVLRLIPGLENARFLRYGQIHRNTYICAPVLLDACLRLKRDAGPIDSASPTHSQETRMDGAPTISFGHTIFFAGQVCGVEGYTESIATGMLAGIYAAAMARGEEPVPAPRATALGSLVHYITHADAKNFQPANITFDLLEPLEEELRKKIRDKKERHRIVCERALAAFNAWRTAIERATSIPSTASDGRALTD